MDCGSWGQVKLELEVVLNGLKLIKLPSANQAQTVNSLYSHYI